MTVSTDVKMSQQLFPVAHLFMQEAIWLGANISLEYAWRYATDEWHCHPWFLNALHKLNQWQLPERAQSLVESPDNLRFWYECGWAQVDEALRKMESLHEHSTLEWIELYVEEWYDATALLLGEKCPATATSFYAGVTGAMTELL